MSNFNMSEYQKSCPQRVVTEIRPSVQTWWQVKLECGHEHKTLLNLRAGDQTGCMSCERGEAFQ
jgi:hypothetical protein